MSRETENNKMNKVKILQFSLANAKGGVTQYVLKNWDFIDKSRFQFDFVTLSKQLDFANELLSQGCKIHYLSCYAEDNEEQFIQEMNCILDEGYDVVHLHTVSWKSFLVEKLAKEKNVPQIIVHAHNTGIDITGDFEREHARILHETQKSLFGPEMATDFCACSDLAADWLFGKQIPKERIQILNNAIDTEEFSYKPEIRKQYRKELQLEQCFVLGHVGRMEFQKNHKMLIDIFDQVYSNNSKARLLLVGDGTLMEEIHQQVDDYGLADKVLFVGKRADVANLFQAMDVFVFPSRFEGLGLSLIEAQATGLPCLVSESIPKEAWITPNITCLPYEVTRWSKEIEKISQGYERIDMSNLIAKAGYSLKEQIKILENLYSKKRITTVSKRKETDTHE